MKTAPTVVSPEPLSSSGNHNVLVAEDDPMFRRILKSWLETWGYRVTLAEDGEKAWQVLQEETQPELLILDWVMPGVEWGRNLSPNPCPAEDPVSIRFAGHGQG
jgi:PleD family two-component response regulator